MNLRKKKKKNMKNGKIFEIMMKEHRFDTQDGQTMKMGTIYLDHSLFLYVLL